MVKGKSAECEAFCGLCFLADYQFSIFSSEKEMLLKKIIVILLAGCCMQVSYAKVVDGVNYEDRLSLKSEQLVLNGAGLRKILFVKVYSAGLYLPQATQSQDDVQKQNGSKRVRLVLRRDVDANDFVDALNDGLKENSTQEQRQAIAKDIEKLVAVIKQIGDVHENDCVDFDFVTNKGVSVQVNGKVIGESIGSKALYDAVLRIWLGDKAIDSGLKKALLNL